MSLDSLFQNLTADELKHASAWIQHLRVPEIPRVQETLRALNDIEFHIGQQSQRARFAVIAAGTSINTNNYSDIDLFLLSREELRPENIGPSRANSYIEKQLDDLPELVYYLEYGMLTAKDIPYKKDLLAKGLGALVTISLFYGLKRFDKRRPNQTDDLLEPSEPMKAEQIIKYNREQGSKFLVLSGQYLPE